jgi:hypothetical protein
LKIWFDPSNSPHINLFAAMIRELERMFLGLLLASARAVAAAVPLVRHGAAAGALTAMTIGFVIAGVCGLLVLRRLPAGSR